jgi:hypothetical protein
VILVGTGQWGGIGTQSYFSYQGDTAEAQAYYDRLLSGYGDIPKNVIESVEAQYRFGRALFFQELQNTIPIFLMILLAIMANAYQLSVLGCEASDKRHAVAKSEGRTTLSLIRGEISALILTLLLGAFLLYRFARVPVTDLALITGLYFIFDVAMLWGVTHFRTRHFAERLR